MDHELIRLLEEYLEYQIQMGAFVESTASAVRSDFRGFLRHLEARGEAPTVGAFTVRHIGTYLAARRRSDRGFKPATLRRWAKSFRGFGQWARDWGYLDRNPMDAIKLEFGPVTRREFMFPDTADAYRFLTVPIKTRLLPEVDRVLRGLLLFMGLRRKEVLKLRWRHVDVASRQISIHDSKATRRKGLPDNLDRVVPMVEPLSRALSDLQSLHPFKPDDPVVFRKIGKPLSSDAFYAAFAAVAAKLALPKDVVPHSMRHNLASQLTALGATSADIALLLGHRSMGDAAHRPTTTDGYITSSLKRVSGFVDEYARLVLSCKGSPLNSEQERSSGPIGSTAIDRGDQGRGEEPAAQPVDVGSGGRTEPVEELLGLLRALLTGSVPPTGPASGTPPRRHGGEGAGPTTGLAEGFPLLGGGWLPWAQTVPGRYICAQPSDEGWNVAVVRPSLGLGEGDETARIRCCFESAAAALRRGGQSMTALYVMPSLDSPVGSSVFAEMLADLGSGRIRTIYAPTWRDVTPSDAEWRSFLQACQRSGAGVIIQGLHEI